MKNTLLSIFALTVIATSSAQFNESAPWMSSLKKEQNTFKSSNQPYTLFEISDSFNDYWKDKDQTKKGSGFKPYKRWENYWKNLVDQNGFIPTSNALWQTWEKKRNRTNTAINPVANWNAIGPFSHGTYSGALAGQGRINVIAVDPNNENIWYVGAPAGGIWKSVDAGLSWTNLFDDFPQIGVSGIAIDPNDSNIIYIATGDDDAADSYSVGVFKSLDGGVSWNETGLNPSTSNISLLMNEIVIDPNNSNTIWVGTNVGLQKSEDAGATWQIKRNGDIKDFKLKPNDPNTIYAVSTNSFYKSIDGGNTFTTITQGIPDGSGRLVLGTSTNNPEVVYVLSAKSGFEDFAYGGLFKSTDSGESFTETANNTDILESNQAWFDLALEVSPTNADEVYIGCLNVWKSTDGGDNFLRINRWNVSDASYTHADIHTISIFNNKVFVGSDGGVYMSNDGGATFTDYTQGLAISQFYRISVAKNNVNKISGGLQDNAGMILDQNQWNVFTGGDGMDYEIDPSNNNLVYGFIQFGSILFISSDSGKSIGTVNPPTNSSGNPIQGNWITPLAIASNGSVYAGFDDLYKLENNEWQKISSSFGIGNIDDLEVDPNNPEIIYASKGIVLYRSINGGVDFTLLTVLPTEVSDIAINNNDSNIVYVTTSNYISNPQTTQPAERGIFKVIVGENTVDLEDITFNIPTDQAFFSIVHQGRHTNNPVYVGTSLGVYRIDDTLTEWEDYFTNFPNVAVSDLEINLESEKLIASTYGRGVWQTDIPNQVPENEIRLVAITPDANRVLCGEFNPTLVVENQGLNPITNIDVDYSISGLGTRTFTWTGNLLSEESTTITLPTETVLTYGEAILQISVSSSNDTYLDNNELSNRFFLNEFGVGAEVHTFENDNDMLIAYNESNNGSIWEKGIPNGTKLNEAASGQNVYATNLNGNHTNSTKGILLSNCYDLSSILAPVLKFKMAFDLEINFDIVYVEYSINDGNSWQVLGNINSEPHWYNSDRTNANSLEADDCQNCPGAQWTGENTTITEYSYDFTANAAKGETDLTNEPNVLFRIVFHSDPAVVQEGAIIDDFVVDGLLDNDDDDNDGILDTEDNCPLIANADQLDTDNDGIGNVCDLDDDGDGILDIDDNCPLTPNPNQEDNDQDGVGNLCDDDIDNDGIPNQLDQCNNTPINAITDVNGCEIFSLPGTNFLVRTTDESCISSNNGSIFVSVENTSYNYNAVLSGPEGIVNSPVFNENTSFIDLASGNYQLCLFIEGQPNYENCFDLTIQQPNLLNVTGKVSSLDNQITLSLSGGSKYFITLNGKDYITTENEITLNLDKESNKLSVKTNIDCQGIHEETIVTSSKLFVYPNPIDGNDLHVYLGNHTSEKALLSIFNLDGVQVFSKSIPTNSNTITLSVDALPTGVYILNVKVGSVLSNYKIIRK